MTTPFAITVVFRFLAAGLYVFLTGVLWGQRHRAPAGWSTVTLMAALGIWAVALHPLLSWCAAAAALAAMSSLARLAWREPDRELAGGLVFLCLLWIAALAAGFDEPGAAIVVLFPGLYLAWLFYWKQPFGLVLTNRSLFAVAMGIFAALYLLAVRLGAEQVERRVGGGFRWAVELALLFGAGLLWIPFYAWISRFLSGRARLYSEFSHSLEQASLILDLSKRLRFLEQQLAERFQLRRAALLPEGTAESARDYNHVLPLGSGPGLMLLDTGTRRPLEDEEAVLRALAPQIAQSIEACRLVEEKIGLERRLARQENLAELGQAAATLAHEIKNPLSSIKTLARLLREDEAVAETHGKDLEFIEAEVDRLDRSVRQLLGFARSNQELNEEVDLSALVRELCVLVGRQARPDGVEVRCDIEQALRVSSANRELLEQAILNPILNAVQASPSGSIVEVTARRQSRTVITIRDHGPGIPEHLRERVFDPFFTTRQRGTGLGLAIARRNMRLLGGDMQFEFPAEGGTLVRLTVG